MKITDFIRDDFYGCCATNLSFGEDEYEIHCSKEINRLLQKGFEESMTNSIIISNHEYTNPAQFVKFILPGLPPMTIVVDQENGYHFRKIEIKPENLDYCKHHL